MGILNDVNKWKAKVEKAIPDVLLSEVRDAVEIDFLHTAQSAVYDNYHPMYYADGSVFGRMRRFGGGGIYDISLITANLAGNKTLVMQQTAAPNSDYPQKAMALDWVESGDGSPGARPFYAPLKARAIPHAHTALVKGLHRRGL